MSLRSRLLLTSLAALAVGLAAMLIVGNVLLDQRVHSEASTVLRANTDAQLSALDVTARGVSVRQTANDAVLDRRSWVLDGQRVIERPPRVSAELDRAAVALGRNATGAEIDGPDEIRLRATPIRAPRSSKVVGSVVVGFDTTSLERLQKIVLLGTLVLAGTVLLGGALAIRGALSGALEPVAQMTESARQWGAHDLDRRFDLGPPRDELTALAATLDELLARIAASRRHEQRFAAEMAHELRTPLAGLQLQAELALKATGPSADAEREQALAAVVAQSARLNTAIDALLAIARNEIDPAAGSVDLAAIATDFDDVEIDTPQALPLAEGDPDVVRRALTPLVENARRHARSRVRLELSAARGRVRVAVRDDGPGLDPELGERAFDPGARGSGAADGGAGLGLPLARRLARSCGGDVIAGPGPGGCFVLELPALGPAT
ncbi:MAG TPA: HAMP domain-containing sensor histidine kinase [Solirubrobacteraceae bacterium]|nr:HAMP domain-containing sensor histidine kinase [Solirubrobacteraceae bacterium]